jgi:integrase
VARPAKPWFWEARGSWCVNIDGKRLRLSPDREEAHRRFHDLMATRHEAPESPNARVADVVEAFLVWAATHTKPATFKQYRWFGQKLAEDFGKHPARDFKPIHVTRWVEQRGWRGAHEYNARRYAFRYFSWAVQEGVLPRNPLSGMKRSKPLPRQRAISDDEYTALLKATDSDFRPLLFALRQTGARPQELRELRWEQIKGDHAVLRDHKTAGKTRKPRVIHFNPVVQRFLAVARKRSRPGSSHVFLNARGEPWTMDAVRLRVMRLKKKLGLAPDLCCYLIRHGWATGALVNGVDVATVAELMGHSSLEMVTGVYAHLAEKTSHLQEAATRAVSRPGSTSRRPRT